MKIVKVIPLVIAGLFPLLSTAATHTLTGRDLTVDKLWEMSAPGEDVVVSKEGMDRIKASYKATIDATKVGMSVYGVSVNFGDLKHQKVVQGDVEKEPNRTASYEFNERQMRIQAAGLEPWLDNRLVKMSMIIRLNQMASGYTGMTTTAAEAYKAYINNDIYPLIPSRGSQGVNDLNWPTHIGLALMEEWDVIFQGKRQPSAEVHKKLGLKKFRPFGLDGIAILSNGNVSEAIVIDSIKRAEHLLDLSPTIVAAGLEALNGNVSPYLWHSVDTKAWPQGHEVSEAVLLQLKGSYLWQLNDKRELQDPLSFRSAQWTLAAAREDLRQLKEIVNTSLNHNSTNPISTTTGRSDLWYSNLPAVKKLSVDGKGTYVNSVANFDFTQMALQVEAVTKAMAHVLHNSAWRMIQIADSKRTKMTTYLVAKENKGGDSFANVAQAVSGLYAEAMGLTNNVTLYGLPTSIYIDDTFNNVSVTADRLRALTDIGYEIFAFEVLHHTQGMEMRAREQGYTLGEGTTKLLKAYRQVVPYVSKDRIFTNDVNNSVRFLKKLDPKSLQVKL